VDLTTIIFCHPSLFSRPFSLARNRIQVQSSNRFQSNNPAVCPIPGLVASLKLQIYRIKRFSSGFGWREIVPEVKALNLKLKIVLFFVQSYPNLFTFGTALYCMAYRHRDESNLFLEALSFR
jgi:hypothetical protein